MYGRVVGIVLVVVVAGCSGTVPTGSTEDAETLTAAPVPEGTESGSDVPGAEGDRVDGAGLGAAHAESLEGGYTRVVHIHVSGPDGIYLDYRETTIVGVSNASLRTRIYEGPGTARFVPDDPDATSARSERYASDQGVGHRRTVDGQTDRVRGSVPPLVPAVPELDDAALVAALLENASVEERTEGSVRLVGATLTPAAVPDYLSDPRRATVRATVRGDGHVPHVSARYGASLDGENVSVTQDVYWLSRPDPVVAPGWYERETGGER